jgi:sec-independent protein translocase protein TatC
MAATAVRTIGHDDRLSLVEHLDELRTRLIICVAALAICFGVCLWQNGRILDIVNVPLEQTAFKAGNKSLDPFEQTATLQQQLKRTQLAQARAFERLAADASSAEQAGEWRNLARAARALAATVPPRQAKKPVTLGVGEPFTQTIKLAGYAALLLALPLILYQLYAFILPAFSPTERKIAVPLLLMVPVLFICGVVFCYFVVLEPATEFLLGFNDEEFTTAVRARDYYSFVALTTIAMGLLFQVPVVILALTRLGITTPAALRKHRRYAFLGCAVLAALLPTIDPLTMILEMIPLIVLYEVSILLAAAIGQPPEPVPEESDS